MKLSINLGLIGLCALLLLTACMGTSPPSQFYMLEPLTPNFANASHPGQESRLTLALAPVKISHYLDRAQIVSAAGKNTYQLDELHRWAERLDENMTRVMLQNLTQALATDVVLTTSKRAQQSELRLAVNVLEFHVDAEQQAKLVAQWQVNRGDAVVLSQQTTHQVPVASEDIALKVQALNQCFNQLSQDIAGALELLKP
jgi:uncharacterized lipoprotein YmbA